MYGVISAVGYNGQLPSESHGRYRPLYHVRKRRTSNGLKSGNEIDLHSPAGKKAVSQGYSITYCGENGHGSVVEYKENSKTDMFQFGRSTEPVIDFIVVDTVPGSKEDIDKKLTQSTISRFACRIVVERGSPNRARVLAGAFDTHRRIFLGENCFQWSNGGKKVSDGLTTNGILVNHPKGPWGPEMETGIWREVSVCGDMFGLRPNRSAKQRGRTVDCSNILQDGTMIDLCGVVLLWRVPSGIAKAPSLEDIHLKRELLNALKAQCPVGLVTLRFPHPNQTRQDTESRPHIYTRCGHVHGYHEWGARPSVIQKKEPDSRTCPFCDEVSGFVELNFGMEPLFYVDNGPASHAFVPCGHVTTEATVNYWSSVTLPYGKDQFRAVCPFCFVPLEGDLGYVKLIFQTHVDRSKEVLL